MSYVHTTDGNMIEPDALEHSYTDISGFIATDTVTDPNTGNTYCKTYTWSGSTLIHETGWVKL